MSPIRSAPTTLAESLRQLGPGLIISAAIVGSGELIVTTKLGADVGFTLLWFIILGCLIKVFLQIEIGRFAVCRGATSLRFMNEMPGPRWGVSWMVWIWLLMFVATFFQIAGMVGGIAATLKLGGLGTTWPDWLWAVVVTGVTAVLLSRGRYQVIERASTLMVAAFTLFTAAAVIALAWTPYAIKFTDLARGLGFRLPDSFTVAFAAFGIIGVGASELIYYPYWCVEKGYGKFVGPDDGTPEWQARARGWLKVLNLDAWVSMVIYTGATIAFYLLGAAVLNAKGVAVTDQNVMSSLSQMYRESFGPAGFWTYLIGALVVLYSTVFIATASNARLTADFMQMVGWLRLGDEPSRQRVVLLTGVVLPIVYLILFVSVGAPVSLVFIGALAQALMLPLLAGGVLYLRRRWIAPELLPGPAWTVLLWISATLMGAIGVYQLVTQIMKRLGG